MSSIAVGLAERALAPVSAKEDDALRALTLTNVAAGAGDRGTIDAKLAALPLSMSRTPSDAAFLLAARLHARTQDDFFPEGRVHVGAIALAATSALADRAGNRLLECLLAGYRVMCTVSDAYSVDAQRRGLRPSGVFGPPGAAASAAVALGLDADATANAIALAAAGGAGHNQAWVSGTDEWILEVGAAARAGVEAALFTEAGVTASPEAYEGRAGWGAAYFGEAGAPKLAAKLKSGVIGPEVVAVKPYPVSGIANVPTSLACDLHDALAADGGGAPESVIVRMSEVEHAYPGSSNAGPFRSRSDALMSVAFCVACALLDGAVPLRRLENPNDGDVRALLERISVVGDPGLAENEATVHLTLDGRELVRTGKTAEILFPTWADAAAGATAIARRSEVDEAVVQRAAGELSREHPDANALRETLEMT